MQNIALQVTLNGIPQAVTNLRELEAAILEAKSVLATTTTIGSDEFKKLSTEISQAESKLKNFKNAAKGRDVAGNLADIGKLGGAIAGSFATATAAVSLFGTESESITKAATTAQNALTIALGAKSAAEGLGVVKTIAANLAQRALTASTVATTAATRAFYTVLAANPYGAILAVVGLLVGALVLLSKTESDNEKQAKAAAKANEAYAESIKTAGLGAAVTAEAVRFLIDELNKGNITLEQATPQLLKFAGALKNIDVSTKEGQKTLNEYLSALGKQAIITDQISAKTAELADAFKNANQTRIGEIRNEILELQRTAALTQSTIDKIEAADVKRGKDREARLAAAAKAEQDRIQKQIAATEARLKAEGQIIGQNLKIGETEAEIITKLEKRIALAQSLASNLDVAKTATEMFNEVTEITTQEFDVFGDVYGKTRKEAEKFYDALAQGQISGEDAARNIKNFTAEIIELNQEGLSPEKQNQLLAYSKKYEILFSTIEKFAKTNVVPPFDLKDFEKAIVNLALLEGRLKIDPFKRTPEELLEAKVNAEKIFQEQETIFVSAFVKLNQKQKDLQGLNTEQTASYYANLAKEGKDFFANLVGIGDDIINFEGDVDVTTQSIVALNKALQDLNTEARKGFILGNLDLITENYKVDLKEVGANRTKLLALEDEIKKKTFDREQKYAKDVTALQKQLADSLPGFAQMSYQQKLIVLQAFLKKEVEATENAEKEKQDATQKTVDKILDTIGQLQAALGAIQSTTSDFFGFQFDQLEKRYQRIQEGIVGDTEEANAKRLEAEKIYNAEKARLEKQAAKNSLRIQLAQTIANAAQAITVALTAGPVVGQILAGVVAAASLAQIGIVTAQLNAVDSYRKGGILKSYATGGYVSGPSHENGGVKFQGGGIELEGRESVINRVSTVRYQDLLNQINLAGGGSPIMANLDDSRIVEAIATQRREPIRAYVVQSEITSSQNIQKRLELLSQI